MNRREFFAALSATGIALAAPGAVLAVADLPVVAPMDGISFERRSRVADHGFVFGLAAQIRVGDGIWRHAIRLPMHVWEQFSPEQREATWKCVERMTYNAYRKLPIMAGVYLPRTEGV